MTTFQTILLTTDFSTESQQAFPVAAGLAQAVGARVMLLHIIPESVPISSGSMFVPPVELPNESRLIADAELQLQELVALLGTDLHVETAVVVGEVERSVTKFVGEHGVDLVIMSTHGRSGVGRLLLGSVTEGVLRKTTVPVLVVPQRRA